jgi:hypothetical protein
VILGSYCGGIGVAWWALMIAFWVGLVAVVVWAVTRLFPSSASSADADEAVEGRRTFARSSGSNGSD